MEVSTETKNVKTGRIISIDIFRGLTILTMIFVNDLASVRNIPAWMQHMPADADGMTFVDLVFPAFLFIVGMSIPFSINKRLEKGDSTFLLWKHIISRTLSLLILGVLMVNIGSLNESETGMNRHLWMLLVFIGAILTWNNYPKAEGERKYLFKILRITGVILLIILAAIYRSGTEDNPGWLKSSWWGILGLIGWAYFASAAVYILFKRMPAAIAGFIAVFIFLYIGEKSGSLTAINLIADNLVLPGSTIGAHASITTAGVFFSILLFQKSRNLREKLIFTVVYTLILFLSGYLLRPLYGISKIYATPAWCLYSAALCCIIYFIIYWIVDEKKIISWSSFLKPAGMNPLLAYILPSIVYAILVLAGITFLSDYFGEGITGIIRSFVYSLIILGVTAALTKAYVRLRL